MSSRIKALRLLFLAALFSAGFPVIAYAVTTVGSLLTALLNLAVTIIPILISLAVLTFFWGLVKFINHAGDEKSLEEGKQLMIWGMVALFIMVALWGIIGFFQTQLGLGGGPAVTLGVLPAQPSTIPPPPS